MHSAKCENENWKMLNANANAKCKMNMQNEKCKNVKMLNVYCRMQIANI